MDRENTTTNDLTNENISKIIQSIALKFKSEEELIRNAREFSSIINSSKTKDAKMASAAALCKYIGAICVLINDEAWSDLGETTATPCGVPECNCHIESSDLYKALNEYRDAILREQHKV